MAAFSGGTTTPAPKLPEGAEAFSLYGGSVRLVFNPNSPRYRYTVTDPEMGRFETSVRGVTTAIGDILHKKDLMSYQMNKSHQFLFGQKFDEGLKQYLYDPQTAFLQPDVAYTTEQLQGSLETARKAHMDWSQRGKDIGTIAHKAVELYLLGEESKIAEFIEEFDPTDEEKKCVRKIYRTFVKWWESLGDDKEVVALERPVYSRRLHYAGTLDLVVRIGKKVVVMDLKTTNASRNNPMGIYPEMFLQLGAYSYALREETGQEMFQDVAIINISKEGKLNILSAVDMGLTVEECEKAFAFGLRLHDWLEVARKSLQEHATTNSVLNPSAIGRKADSGK